MKAIGFDNDKYLKEQSEKIRERIEKFGGKLYLEFGGKLFDDFHASRVLPGSLLVLASFFLFASILIKELFPTLDLPQTAIIGLSGVINCEAVAAEVIKVAFFITSAGAC